MGDGAGVPTRLVWFSSYFICLHWLDNLTLIHIDSGKQNCHTSPVVKHDLNRFVVQY